jgi:CxxC motif-containing protein
MKRSTLTCILCPNGCELRIEWIDEDGAPRLLGIAGNLCPRGLDYATEEITAPVRTVTTTVRVRGGVRPLLSVRTAAPVPRSTVPACLNAMRAAIVTAPIQIGETIIDDIAGTGVAVIATRAIARSKSANGG